MQSSGSEVGYNKGFAAAYELGWSDFSRKAAEAILPFFAENTPKNTERLALDLTCGTRTFARALVAAGFKVTGVDKSQPMLDLARKASSDLGEEECRVEYVCADMSELPSLSKRFFTDHLPLRFRQSPGRPRCRREDAYCRPKTGKQRRDSYLRRQYTAGLAAVGISQSAHW